MAEMFLIQMKERFPAYLIKPIEIDSFRFYLLFFFAESIAQFFSTDI